MITHATLGSWPGTDMAATSRMVLGECPDHATIPELPSRGPHAAMVGRTFGMIDALSADFQPTGWRLIDAPGIDQRRARSTLRDDVEIFAEQAQGFTGEIVLTSAGPWTVAATTELARGSKVLADSGARRDVAHALGEGIVAQVARVRRLVPTASVRVQLDEPMLPSVMQGSVPTASGLRKVRAIEPPELETTLTAVCEAVEAPVTLHCCAPGFDPGLPLRVGADAVACDVSSASVASATMDALARHLEQGGRFWWGLVDTREPDRVPRPANLLTRAMNVVRPLELPRKMWLEQVVLTPACGMAGWSIQPATRTVRALAQIARDLTEEIGSR